MHSLKSQSENADDFKGSKRKRLEKYVDDKIFKSSNKKTVVIDNFTHRERIILIFGILFGASISAILILFFLWIFPTLF